tara:strand:+ start:1878 stop:1997 length:120 start_codon:yes stop_codon:yes gene_type:complete
VATTHHRKERDPLIGLESASVTALFDSLWRKGFSAVQKK